jgi:hypothetical protein
MRIPPPVLVNYEFRIVNEKENPCFFSKAYYLNKEAGFV